MKHTMRVLILISSIMLISSCANWDPHNNPIENSVKKLGGFVDNLHNKFKYSSFTANYEHNRKIYYQEELNKFLESNYKTKQYSGSNTTYVIEKTLGRRNDGVDDPKKIHDKLANYCTSHQANFPKFHKVAGDQNSFSQKVNYSIKDQRIFEHKFQSKGIGKYIGEFSCFKKNIGVIWQVSIKTEFEKIGSKEIAFINVKQLDFSDIYIIKNKKCVACSNDSWLR